MGQPTRPPLLYLLSPFLSPRWCCTFHVITQKQTKNKVMGSRQKLGRPAIGRRRTTTAATTNKMELGRYSIFYRRIATVRIAVLMDRLPFLFLLLLLFISQARRRMGGNASHNFRPAS
jgi:hypothetical protein